MLDLLVIGAGLSGLSAAIYAAQKGLSVRVVTKGLSALHWGTGSIDLFGYLPNNTPVDMPLAALDQLPAPHPFRQIEKAATSQAVVDLQNWAAEQGLPYISQENRANLWLPSAVGAKRPTYLAPAAQATARLDQLSPLLIVGFEGMRDFYPTLIADNLTHQGHPARALSLPLALISDRYDANTIQLAQGLEAPARLDALAQALRPQINPGERVAFPAILGVARHTQVIAQLESTLGVPIAEIPTLPPSVPGIRLHQALVRKLETLGARVESNMAAVEFGAQFGSESSKGAVQLEWIATATGARPLRHRAHNFLLATGGFLGGGFESDHKGRVWESVFHLPLSLPAQRSQWFSYEFLDPAGHPLFQGGVVVNQAWHPVDAEGRVIYSNLWAAGNLLAHTDAIHTRSHEGVALVTAAAAAEVLVADRMKVS